MVLSIALPMTLAYLTTPLLGIVDTAVVGQMGDAALLAGLAAGAIVFDVVFTSFNFLRLGTTGLVSQAFGRGDSREEQAIFWRSCMVAFIAGVALMATTPLIVACGTWFLDAGPRVTKAMAGYVQIRLVSAPFALLNYALLGYVLGRGEGGTGLALQMLLNVSNIALSVYLGLVLGWGLEGVAWGTVGGEALATLAGFFLIIRRFRGMPAMRPGAVTNMVALKTMFALNRDIMLRSFILIGAIAIMVRQGAQLGTLTLATNAVLMNFFLLASFLLDGFATAAEQIAGRAVGAVYRPAFDRAVKLTLLWGFGFAVIIAILFLHFGDACIALVTTTHEVQEEARRYLPWAALTGLAGVLAFQMDGVYIGATWSRDMRNMMVLSLVIYLTAVLTLGQQFGNHGLWASLCIFLLTRGLSLLALLPSRAVRTFGNRQARQPQH